MSRPSRGFTLVELLVATAVSALVIVAAMALLSAQERVFRNGNEERLLQESGRIAIDELTANLRMAGFGIDPALAFDFGALGYYPQPQAPAGQSPSSPGYLCSAPVTCRDSVAGSDEIVFRARNPAFGHYLTRVPTTSTLTINGPLRGGLKAGQVLQVACQSGNYTWAYVTVDQNVAEQTAAVEVTVPLRAGNGAAYPRQNGFLATEACFQSTAAMPASPAQLESITKVLKVDLYRYFIQQFGGRPYLMLDQGFDNVDATVVAQDVEDLQFAYVFPFAAAGAQLVGAASGTQLARSAAGIDLAPSGGYATFSTLATDAALTTHFPANIRSVQVSAVVRAPSEAVTLTSDRTVVPAAGNRPDLTGRPAYRRFLIQTSASTRNLDARAPSYPVWSPGSQTFNAGGG